MGPFEQEAREFLGERTARISESAYLFSLAKLVRTREMFLKASLREQPSRERPSPMVPEKKKRNR